MFKLKFLGSANASGIPVFIVIVKFVKSIERIKVSIIVLVLI